MQLAVLFQLTYWGIPMLYYGDEVGMTGGPDPDCRRPMVWDRAEQDGDLLAWHRKLLALRRELAPLRRGDVRTWLADGEKGVYGFLRRLERETVGVVLNNSPHRRRMVLETAEWKDGTEVVERLSGTRFTVKKGRVRLTLAPMSGAVLTSL